MKIGEIAELTGLKASTIRFYEEQGLLHSVGRERNGYRQFDEQDAERLRLLKMGKELGFSLDEMRAIVSSSEEFQPTIMRALEQRLAHVDQMMQALRRQRVDLLDLRTRLQEEWAQGRCLKAGATEAAR